MASVKLHAFINEDDGTKSCDYRDQGELHGTHRTINEAEYGPDVTTNNHIEEVLRDGPALNRMLKNLTKNMVPSGPVSALLGSGFGIRIGVFDR